MKISINNNEVIKKMFLHVIVI